MASFISALALFVLVLSNGCFTLPVDNKQFSTSTSSSLHNLTNEQTLGLQLVSNNETISYPYANKHYTSILGLRINNHN